MLETKTVENLIMRLEIEAIDNSGSAIERPSTTQTLFRAASVLKVLLKERDALQQLCSDRLDKIQCMMVEKSCRE